MSKILHEQQGLRIVQNDKNGFCICTLHYTADPRKRSEAWKKAARQGLSQAQFDQEFEISYDAHMGEKVFPELKSRRHEIVLREGPFEFGEWPSHLPMWGGFDYGSRNPSSFHVYTIVDGITYAIWEMYKPCKNILEFAKEMKECPFWNQIRYIAHDPDMCNLKQRDLTTGAMTNVIRQFETLGITKWLRGDNNEQSWLVQMQKHWCGPEVTFKILQSCPMLLDELEQATYVTMTERQLETQNYKESMVDKFNHSLDDLKYFMNSTPNANIRKLRLPSLVDSYGWGAQTNRYMPSIRQEELGEWA